MSSSLRDSSPEDLRPCFLVCEPIACGFEHVPFNAGLLTIIRTGHPERRIVFCAESEHSEHVKRQLGEELASSSTGGQRGGVVLQVVRQSFGELVRPSELELVPHGCAARPLSP